MKIVAGIDIGNATTEIAIGKYSSRDGSIEFFSGDIVSTTGIKGTAQNIHGVFQSIKKASEKAGIRIEEIDLIRINEAAPVIGDVAMETITETIITESTMIGHNPSTPGGLGSGTGITVNIKEIGQVQRGSEVIVVIPREVKFDKAAAILNEFDEIVQIRGAVVQNDDAVLINNRLRKKIPIVDEVLLIDKIPIGMRAAVEVAPPGGVIEVLSNPYGIATLFNLDSDETKHVVPISRALIGNRSAVVIKTPKGDVKERVIPAGKIHFIGERVTETVDIDKGAQEIMKARSLASPLQDVKGDPGSNAGGMLERVRQVMSELTEKKAQDIKIQDILAVDTFVPQKVQGGLAEEFALENAVGIAAMVKSDRLQMDRIADKLSEQLGIEVEVGGVEADMAIRGALTTPGCNKPLAIIDIGAGSTDASVIDKNGAIQSVHLGGAGNMVTMIIKTELGIETFEMAEDIKKYPLAKVESLFNIRHEDGSVEFFEESLNPNTFAKVVILKEGNMIPLEIRQSLEKIREVRRNAKQKVFVTNALRALSMVSHTGNVRDIEFVVLVGGSALDFEVPQMITDALSQYKIVSGRANIRGTEGPRNAVATGLLLSFGREGDR